MFDQPCEVCGDRGGIFSRDRYFCYEHWCQAIAIENQSGVIYFIQAENGGPVKIGWTKSDPEKRLVLLQTGNPERLAIKKQFPGSRQDERFLHDQYAELHVRGEWFSDEVLSRDHN